MANLPRWQATIVDEKGNVLPSASIEVRSEATGLIVSVYSDPAGTVPLGNPFLADSQGYAFFHAAVDTYKITATSGATTRIWRFVDLPGVLRASTRIVPPADPLQLFVRDDGNDANSGTVDAPSGAFKHINRATSVLMGFYDLMGRGAIINITTAPVLGYPEVVTLGPYLGRTTQGHAGPVVIQGIPSNPTGVVINPAPPAGGSAVQCLESGGFEWVFKNLM